VITMREFVNLNISRNVMIDLITNNHWKMIIKMRLKSQ
jgi:hypothetical protein